MGDKVRVVVVGCGGISNGWFKTACARPDVEVVGLTDLRPEAAEKRAQEHELANAVVGADLNVYACHNTAYSEHGKIGSMRDRTFKELWFSEDAKKAFCSLNPSVVCRHECANHKKVELFNMLAHASLDNFV